MAPPVPVLRVSHAVEEVGKRLFILCLGGKGATVDSTGVLMLRGRSGGQITTLGEDLLSVGVVCFHAVSLQGQRADEAGHGSFRFDVISLDAEGLVTLQECAVHPLSHAAVAIDHQAHHVTAAAVVTRHAARVPLHNGGTGERRQDDTLAGSARTLHIDEHGQVS